MDYWGSKAIQRRLSISHPTLTRWRLTRAFPLYRRRDGHKGAARWFTSDALILAWEQAQCDRDRRTALIESHSRAIRAGVFGQLCAPCVRALCGSCLDALAQYALPSSRPPRDPSTRKRKPTQKKRPEQSENPPLEPGPAPG